MDVDNGGNSSSPIFGRGGGGSAAAAASPPPGPPSEPPPPPPPAPGPGTASNSGSDPPMPFSKGDPWGCCPSCAFDPKTPGWGRRWMMDACMKLRQHANTAKMSKDTRRTFDFFFGEANDKAAE